MSYDGRGLLILGASGTGKSSLALQLMGLGAKLVADDRVDLVAAKGIMTMSAPERIAGLIEARGIGILHADHGAATLSAIVHLDLKDTERVPPKRTHVLLGHTFPCLHQSANPAFPFALMQFLKAGRAEI